MTETRQQRVAKVNALLEVIAVTGRRFFIHEGRLARMTLDAKGRLWWTDEWSGKWVYLNRGSWADWAGGIHHGGGLRTFIQGLREFILRGTPLRVPFYFEHWGYGEDIHAVIQKAIALGIAAQVPASAP